MEQPESVRDSFILSATPDDDAGDNTDAGDSSESLEATTAPRRSSPTPLDAAWATLKAAPREMQEVEGLLSLSVLAPMRGNALRSAVG